MFAHTFSCLSLVYAPLPLLPPLLLLLCQRLQAQVTQLGGVLVSTIDDCTLLVTTTPFKRSVKLLTALARGIPTVTEAYLAKSSTAGAFLDPLAGGGGGGGGGHMVKDKTAEKKWGFDMAITVKAAKVDPRFESLQQSALTVLVTAGVRPGASDLSDMLRGTGVAVVTAPAALLKVASGVKAVVSCAEDYAKVVAPLVDKHGIPAYTSELLLTGILQHKLDLGSDQHVLSGGGGGGGRKRK